LVVFAALWLYRTAYLHSTAGLAAERAAFVWEDAKRDVATGKLSPGNGDGLYWRLSSDMVSAVLGMFGDGSTQIEVPANGRQSSGLTERKLLRSAALLPAGTAGSIRFTSTGWTRAVDVSLRESLQMPLGGVQIAGSHAQSYVTEPVEWIRLIDLTRTYVSEIKDRISPKQAAGIFRDGDGASTGETVTIRSEREAASYLRKLVSGVEREFMTPAGEKRLVDALDGGGIAHQAFYTYTEGQLRSEQLRKDLDLLRAGKVQGIVWHFFKGGSAVPKDSFRAELESKGIVVVIHT